MLTVHHLNNSRSQRVLWLLEELGVPYVIQRYERDAKTMLAPASLKKIHPLGKSPVITEGGAVVAESGAIIEYLLGRHDLEFRFHAKHGSPEWDRQCYWLHYAEGSAMTPLLLALVFQQVAKAPMPFIVKPVAKAIAAGAMKSYIQPQIDLHLDYIEAELAKTGWFAGASFSAADIQMSFVLEAAAARGRGARQRPHSQAFLQAIHARPAYQAALEKGGPYDLLA